MGQDVAVRASRGKAQARVAVEIEASEAVESREIAGVALGPFPAFDVVPPSTELVVDDPLAARVEDVRQVRTITDWSSSGSFVMMLMTPANALAP